MHSVQLLVLLWKNWILHRRHYFVTTFEIASPILLSLLLLFSFAVDPFYQEGSEKQSVNKYNATTYSLFAPDLGQLRWTRISYAPNYQSVNELMTSVFRGTNVVLRGYTSERDITERISDSTVNTWGNIIFYNFKGRDFSSSLQYEICVHDPSFIDPPGETYYTGQISKRLEDDSPYKRSGFLALQISIDLAYIKYRMNKTGSIPGSFNLQLHVKRLPVPKFDEPNFEGHNLYIIIPFYLCTGLLFFFLVIVKRMADEKNNRAKEVMKMMGMTTPEYWGSAFLSNFVLAVIICVIITCICTISVGNSGSVLQDNSTSLFLLILLLYCASSLLLCFIISTLFTKSSISVTITVVLWVSTIIITNSPETLSQQLSSKIVSCLIPNLAIKMIFLVIYHHEVTGSSCQWGNIMEPPMLSPDNFSVGSAIIMMLFSCVLYTFLLLYLDAVWPWQPGIPKSPFFFLDESFWQPEHNIVVKGYNDISVKSKYFEEENESTIPSLVIYHMTKEYGTRDKKLAVDDLSLNIYHGQITALVGRNGSGKTTIINILSGNFPPTSGTATIKGCDIVKETNAARRNLGICPEYTVLYNTLTVEEHLKLFAGLRGKHWWKMPSEIIDILQWLQLSDKAKSLSKDLTRGMQRKLSLANAIIGNPEVLILDEPTAGLDPESRQCIWNLLQNLRSKCTILLTTDYMEEADALGDQIAIVVLGRLQCCGSSLFLKNIFDAGYHLRIEKGAKCQEDAITQLIHRYVPEAKMIDNNQFEITYFLLNEVTQFIKLFQELENSYERFGIQSCGIDVTTMDEVFLKISEMSEELYQVNESRKTSENEIDKKGVLLKQRKKKPISGSITSASFRQMAALFVKRAQYAKRNIALLFYQIFLPLCTVLFFLHFDDTMTIHSVHAKRNNFEFDLCNTFDEEKYGVFQLIDNGSNTQTLAKNYNAVLKNQCVEPLNLTKSGDLEKYLLSSDTQEVRTYAKRYVVGASLHENRGMYYLTAWFNGINYHMDPMSVNLITNALLRFLTKDKNSKISLAARSMSSSTHASIYTIESSTVLKESLNVVFLPVGLTILSSSFVLFPVHERVSRVKLLQRMCGISGTMYWLINFLWDFFTYTVSSLLMIIPFFDNYRNNGLISFDAVGGIFLLLLLYGMSSIPLTYVASFMVTTPSGGFAFLTILNMLVGITGTVVMAIFTNFTNKNVSMVMWFLRLFPNFATTWGIKNIYFRSKSNVECSKYDKEMLYRRCKHMVHHCCTQSVIIGQGYITFPYYSWNDFSAGKEYFALSLMFVVWSGLTILLETKIVEKGNVSIKDMHFIKKFMKPHVQKRFSEDSEVCNESQRIDNIVTSKSFQEEALVVHKLTKDFGSLRAVNGLTFGVGKKECFGLLGVDGAGKTTTFRVLTGDLVPSSGNAYIQHANIRSSLKEFQKNIGYCPQADALLDRLNAREMLRLFASLRGVPKRSVENNVNTMISMCDLDEFKDKEIYTYSGGTKRKLCLAVALIGAPPVILLDEPTLGVDPVSRRKMWETLTTVKDTLGLSFLLTSHSMEECEKLCNRIAIMANGEFRCLGSMRSLKSKFGKGYTIIAKLRQPSKRLEELKRYIVQNIPNSQMKGDIYGTLHYHTTNTSLKWSEMFSIMEKAKDKFDLQDYIVSGTRLEQIFLTFARDRRGIKQ